MVLSVIPDSEVDIGITELLWEWLWFGAPVKDEIKETRRDFAARELSRSVFC